LLQDREPIMLLLLLLWLFSVSRTKLLFGYSSSLRS
jgi:hypothetical protein